MKDLDKAFTLRLVTGECIYDGFGRGIRIPGAKMEGLRERIPYDFH